MKKFLAAVSIIALAGCGVVSKDLNEDAQADSAWVLKDAAISGHSQAFVSCATQLNANATADLAAPPMPKGIAVLSALQKAEDEKSEISALIKACQSVGDFDPVAYAAVLGAVGIAQKIGP